MSVISSEHHTWDTEILGSNQHEQKSSEIKIPVADVVCAPKERIDDPCKHDQRHPNRSNVDRGETRSQGDQGRASSHEVGMQNITCNEADRNMSLTVRSAMSSETMPAAYEWPLNEQEALFDIDFDTTASQIGSQFDEHDLSDHSPMLEMKDDSDADMAEAKDEGNDHSCSMLCRHSERPDHR